MQEFLFWLQCKQCVHGDGSASHQVRRKRCPFPAVKRAVQSDAFYEHGGRSKSCLPVSTVTLALSELLQRELEETTEAV